MATFEELGLNRQGFREDQSVATKDSVQASNTSDVATSRRPVNLGNPDTNDSRQIQTGTVIQSCFWRSTSEPARVEIWSNDITLYDASVGGGGTIGGNTAALIFARADLQPGTFLIQKRHGKTNDLQNVFEMFYEDAASGGQNNYVFIGRDGIGANVQNYTDFVVLHGVADVRAEINRVHNYISRPTIDTLDVNKVDNTKEGVQTYIAGEGKDGATIMGFLVELLTFSDSPSFQVGDTITGNVTGATALITFKIDANNYYANHTSYGVDFDPATDNACTTDGTGGGSGTGNLSADVFGTLALITIDDNLIITTSNHILPDTDNAYDIGSASKKIKDLHVGGRLNVGKVTDAGPMTATAGTVGDIVFNTSNSKFYGCTATGSPATWAALN